MARWETGERKPVPAIFGELAVYMDITVSEVWDLVRGTAADRDRTVDLEGRVLQLEKQVEIIVGLLNKQLT